MTQNSIFSIDHNFENGSTVLTIAVKSGNLEEVRSVVNRRADVNKRETGGATPLMLAVYLNNLEIVELLVNGGASVNLGDSFETPLMLATRKGHLEIMKFLLSKCADTNIVNLDGITPLFLAIKEQKLAAVEILMSGGKKKSISIYSPSIYGIKQKKLAPVERKERKILSGDSPLIYAIKVNSSKEIIKYLLKHGVDEAPLSWAAQIGPLDIVNLLVNYGADCDRTDADGNTPIATAVRYRRNDIVKYFISKNVNVCKVGTNGKTPLQWAVENEDLHLVNYLLDHGAIYVIDTELESAIASRNLELFKCLHEKAACKDKKYKVKVLTKALQIQSYEIASYLLENGCTLDDLEDCISHLLMCVESKNFQMVQLLTKFGIKSDKIEARTGHTPLTKSVTMQDFEMVAHFIQNGASVKLPNKDNKTPLAIAAEFKLGCLGGHQEVAFEVKGEEVFEASREKETKEKTLAEKKYYVIEFD